MLSNAERALLEERLRLHDTAKPTLNRCRIILLCANGVPTKEVAAQLGVHAHTVRSWRKRFLKDRIECLADEHRAGRGRAISDATVTEVIKRTLQPIPKGARRWSSRALATKTGVSHATIRRIWAEYQLQPHRSESSKLSAEALLIDSRHNISALYLSPLNQAIVLGPAEVSRIQSDGLEQLKLSRVTDRVEIRPRYIRSGPSSLCVALNVIKKIPVNRDFRRHESTEFFDFFKQIDRRLPHDQEVHIVIDNYTADENPKMKKWLSRQAHWRFHFMPSSPSWINYVERWFAESARRELQFLEGVAVTDLEGDIATFIDAFSESPNFYKWVKPSV